MKNLTYLFTTFFCLSLLVFSSCGDDDSSSGPTAPANANLEGTIWVQSTRIVSDCADEADNENSSCDSDCDALLINTDGTIEIANEDGIFSVPYTKSASTLMVETEPDNTLDVNYAISGNTMTITFEEDSCNVTETYNASQSLALAGTSWAKIEENKDNCTDPANDCGSCTFDQNTILLLADGTGTSTSPNDTTDFSYTTNSNMITVEFDQNGQPVTMTLEYKIISDLMVLEFNDADDGCDVVEIYRGS